MDIVIEVKFLSTPSARRATLFCSLWRYSGLDFYPRPPRGGRPAALAPAGGRNLFLSTPSARRATTDCPARQQDADISIHALREEGDDAAPGLQCSSAHFYPRPPRGGRPCPTAHRGPQTQISIHALREEGDIQLSSPAVAIYSLFLSTPSARRATIHCCTKSGGSGHFYPRPPRGGRPGNV